MRKFVVALCLLPLCAFGLDVTINYGKESKEYFSVLNIAHTDPLECNENRNTQDEVTYVVCTIERTPVASFSPTQTLFFHFWSRVVDGRFYLYIEPVHKMKLFATPKDLKTATLITKEQPTKSAAWQIIGYKNEIPFLNDYTQQAKPRGLNFPIKIIKNNKLFFNDLDINRGPLRYDEGEDFATYTQIKNLMKNHAHIEAVKLIDETLIAYPKTIFAKDLLLFRLRALEHFDSTENSDMIVDMGTKWIKKYPTDSNVPEVLYYLGNAYADMRITDEAKYYLERLISEYPQSHYMPLAKMSLAKYFHSGQDANVATKLFAQAYQEAKDLDSASAVAIEWSKFHLLNGEKAQAQKLVETMLKVNPSYITKYPIKSYEYLKLLAEEQLYASAAKLGEYLYEHILSDDISKEDLLNNVSLWYQSANDVQDAHRINKIFLQEFEHRPLAEEIKDRDDKLLFALVSNEESASKIKKYDYIIEQYPNTPEQEKAFILKAQTLFDEGKYSEVLALKDNLKDQSIVAQSYKAMLSLALKEKDCKNVANIFLQYQNVSIEEDEKMPLFDCLYALALNKEAAKISLNMAAEAKDLSKKLEWLYRDSLNFAKLGDSKSTARAGRDALEIAKNLQKAQYYDVGFTLFDALIKLNDKEGALQTYAFLKQTLADDQRMFAVNLTLLKNAEAQKDEMGIDIYAKDILRLQKLIKDNTDSPYVDFALAQSYIRTQRTDEAISVLDDLLQKNISDDDKQKTLYLKGSLLKAQGKDAQESFKQCEAIRYEGAWRSLCVQALDILKGNE
ncbi:tetratricopeptide repeat protein [Helicobacter typhlonius]|uniref:tetratricopeptide repeat protein n=1 Tax=Helicobacter typhlonius TaxID=76936 RepID=UPI002FE1EB03